MPGKSYDLETRVLNALDKSRPLLHSHGGDVELLSVEGGVVKLRLQGSCRSCPSSTVTLKQAIEKAIYEEAPDVTEIVTGDIQSQEPAMSNGLVQLKGLSNTLTNKHGYDQCVGVGKPEQTILHSTVKGEFHG